LCRACDGTRRFSNAPDDRPFRWRAAGCFETEDETLKRPSRVQANRAAGACVIRITVDFDL
jgi:hypothetical protein